MPSVTRTPRPFMSRQASSVQDPVTNATLANADGDLMLDKPPLLGRKSFSAR